ncbi:MAG TPA: hypothetical protein VF824_08000 [Thermoanaerobaculia bacterium]|jgi:hypothetical protein
MRTLLAVLTFAATSLSAATMGVVGPGLTTYGANPPFTSINATHPATTDAAMTSATVIWSGPCSSAFKLKFLRPQPNGTLFVLAERGPFNATGGVQVVTFNAVEVANGDLIGVTVLALSGCQGLTHTFTAPSDVAFLAAGDPAAGAFVTPTLARGLSPNVAATSDGDYLAGVIPVVGSAAGVGTFFRTGLQLANNGGTPVQGRLVFHPAGSSGSPGDPSTTYSLVPRQTKSFADVVATLGRSGLGSIDVIVTSGYAPQVTARVYADNGETRGTAGFTEPLITPSQFLRFPESGTLSMPADPANFRVNIGVRTPPEQGAALDIFVYSSGGVLITGPVRRTYDANFFEQIPFNDFTGLTGPLPADALIVVQVSAGRAIFYSATTDNRSSDPVIAFPSRR